MISAKKILFVLFCLSMINVFAGSPEAYRKGGFLILENSHAYLKMRVADFSIQEIKDLKSGTDWIAEPGGDLFSLIGRVEGKVSSVWYLPPPGLTLAANDFPLRSFSRISSGEEAGWRLIYRNGRLGKGHVNVEITVTLAEKSSLFAWNIKIENRSTVPLQQVSFPILRGLGSSRPNAVNTEYLAVPLYSGVRAASPRRRQITGPGQAEYPGSGMSIQLFTYCDGQNGAFYFAAHDSQNWRKTYSESPSASKCSFTESFIHYADEPYNPGTWTLPYPVMAGPITGDWYDAAKLYRKWAVSQPRWEKSLAKREELPGWFRSLPLWFQGNLWTGDAKAMLRFADRIVAMRRVLGYDFGFHWYLWQRYVAHDYNYPDYFPARPGFKEAVRRVQSEGVKVMPYLNIHLAETQLPLWKKLRLGEAAKVDPVGKYYRSYGVGGAFHKVQDTADVFRGEQKGRDMVPMCAGETVWHDLIVDTARILLEQYHVDLIYYDETYVFPGICFSKIHEHSWIGGSAHADGISAIYKAVHELRPERVVTTGENLGESYIDVCDALLNAHSDMKPDSLPIFQVVYSDRTTEIGCFVNQAELSSLPVFASKLAFMLTRGRQLGWLNTDQGAFKLLEPGYKKQLELLKKYCDVRIHALPWLFEGEMLRPPEFPTVPTVKRRWEIWPSFKQKIDYEFPVISGGMFRAPDGSLGLVLCNLTDRIQNISIPWNSRDWRIGVGTDVAQSEYRNGTWRKLKIIPLPSVISATLNPYEPLLIRFVEK